MNNVLLCPRDNQIGTLSDDGATLELHSPASSKSTNTIAAVAAYSRFPDSQWIQADDTNDALDRLAEATRKCQSLDFTLMLFDDELSVGVRELVAKELDKLLEIEANRNYVLDIVFAAPLHPTADIQGAVATSKGSSRSQKVIGEIVDAQPRVKLLFDAWLSLLSHEMVKPDERQRLNATLVNFGVYRRLAIEGKTQVEVEKLVGILAMQPGLPDTCDPRVLRSFVSHYKESLPRGQRAGQPSAISDEPLKAERDERSKPGDWVTAKVGKAEDLAEWASKQVNTAAAHFESDRDDLGRRVWRQLVEDQTRCDADQKHVVKSLCNLSKQCTIMGRTELALEVLKEAFSFQKGIDAVAYVQLADEFVRHNDSEKAAACYAKAQSLESDPERSQQIRRKSIRILSAQGQYERALDEHFATPNFSDRADVLTDIGTLKRKLGDLRAARSYFWQAIDRDNGRHQAFVGLAESKRQSGKLHDALGAYNSILRDFPEMDPGSEKIYRLAQSSLFRLTHQFERSRDELAKLYSRFRHDVQVKRQYGRMLVMMGDQPEAEKLLGQIDPSQSLTLADELYSLAMATNSSSSRNAAAASSKLISDYLPEDRGLATCRQAFHSILNEAFEDVWHLTSSAVHVDKLHRDFGLVLGYHAQKRVDPNFSYESVQPLARIAKRGFRELKASVIAISEHRFEDAVRLERDMCMLVA